MSACLKAGRAFLDILYPPTCLSCGGRTPSPRDPLCLPCTRGIERPEPEVLAQAVDRLPDEARNAFGTVFALWLFDTGGGVQRVLHSLKYHNRPQHGVLLGRLIGTAFRNAHPDLPLDAILPVPLHRTRELERGYNQSAMLARGIAEATGAPCREDVLVRHRPTISQTGLSRAERWTNVSNVFAVRNEDDVAGTAVLVIDDVLTTGSTAASVALTLQDAGARAVHLATLAYARG